MNHREHSHAFRTITLTVAAGLRYFGADVTKFRNFDAQPHEATLAMKLVASSSDGKAVIQSFAHVQESCLGCHQAFRKPFVEHFYGAR